MLSFSSVSTSRTAAPSSILRNSSFDIALQFELSASKRLTAALISSFGLKIMLKAFVNSSQTSSPSDLGQVRGFYLTITRVATTSTPSPLRFASAIGNFGPLVLCTKISNNIKLLDPLTLKSAYLDARKYWASPFTALLSSRQLVEYIVLDVEMNSSVIVGGGSKYASAYVQVARLSDFGKNDNIFIVKTHIGHLLNPGDYVLGYDLYGANVDDTEIDKYKNLDLPHAILVKKMNYEDMRQKRCGKARSSKLKSLNMEIDRTDNGRLDEEKTAEYEEFLRDLEEDPEMRFDISLYSDEDNQPSGMVSSLVGEGFSSVLLDELIAELTISDEEESNADSMKE